MQLLLGFRLRVVYSLGLWCWSDLLQEIGQVPTFTGTNLADFWTGDPLIVYLKAPNPEKHVYQKEHVFWATLRAIRTKNVTSGLADESEKRKKGGSQHRNISPTLSQPICTKFCEFVDLTEVVTPAKFVPRYALVFPGWEVQKSLFPLESQRPMQQCHALPRWLVVKINIAFV